MWIFLNKQIHGDSGQASGFRGPEEGKMRHSSIGTGSPRSGWKCWATRDSWWLYKCEVIRKAKQNIDLCILNEQVNSIWTASHKAIFLSQHLNLENFTKKKLWLTSAEKFYRIVRTAKGQRETVLPEFISTTAWLRF